MRRNVYSLTDQEWNAFVAALDAVKAAGIYDDFTQRHWHAMMTLTPWSGDSGTSTRNVAHLGPSFFPWHRMMLREFEIHLQQVDPTVWVPYWPWEQEPANWTTTSLWSPQRMGGNGLPITTGPFADWVSTIWNNDAQAFVPRNGIRRNLNVNTPLPNWAGMGIAAYDVAPWSSQVSGQQSFREAFETAHNTVHTHIGGDMNGGTSPNDPIFYLHHANVDRAWATWQTDFGIDSYLPVAGGPPGHNLDDVTQFTEAAGVRLSETLDWRVLGYNYDTLVKAPIAATPAGAGD